jgi:hypothetical protein
MAWLTGWSYRKKITIDETKIDADLTNFPVLVKLTSSNFNFSKARSDGYDIRFTSSDGATLLKYERERHDATNQVAEYWVKIPSVSGSSDTDFYIYYGKSDASDGADPTNVWDSNFKTVLHMAGADGSTTFSDSCASPKSYTANGNSQISSAASKIGSNALFDGTLDWLSTPYHTDFNFGSDDFLIEGWIRQVWDGGYNPLCGKRGGYSPDGWLININPTTHHASFGGKIDTTWNEYWMEGTTALAENTWYYLAVLRIGSTWRLIVNDTVEATLTKSGTLYNYNGNFVIAADNSQGSEGCLNGRVDEFRVTKGTRSSTAWVKASYHSGNNSLVSYGSEEVPVAGRSQGFIF